MHEEHQHQKSQVRTPPLWAQRILLAAILLYPVIGIRYLPFGNGGRYLSSITGPLALVFLLVWHRQQWRLLLSEAAAWLAPFLPFLIAYLIVMAWHGLRETEPDVLSRLLWGSVTYLGALHAGLRRDHLFWAAAVGAFAYFAAALWDIAYLGEYRAGGGANPVHFAFVAMWLAGLAALGAALQPDAPRARRIVWLLAALCGLIACILAGTRAALLALVALYALAMFATHGRQRRTLQLSAAIGVVALAGFSAFYDLIGDRIALVWQEVNRYYTEPSFTFSGVGARLELWRIGLELFAQHPLLGAGFTGFAQLAPTASTMALDPGIRELPHMHSDWVHTLAFGGTLLLAGHLTTILLLARAARRDPPRLWILLAALSFGLVDVVLHGKFMLSFFVAAWAVYAAAGQNDGAKAGIVPGR
jgi:O-antigen ligase